MISQLVRRRVPEICYFCLQILFFLYRGDLSTYQKTSSKDLLLLLTDIVFLYRGDLSTCQKTSSKDLLLLPTDIAGLTWSNFTCTHYALIISNRPLNLPSMPLHQLQLSYIQSMAIYLNFLQGIWTIPRLDSYPRTHPRLTLPRPDISPTGHFPDRIFFRLFFYFNFSIFNSVLDSES